MNTKTAERPGTDIVALVEANPVMVLTDRQKFSQFYEEMKRETDAHVPDLTTDKGRKAIASLARRVATTKVLIDDAGKKLNEGKRAEIDAVDESRREIRQQLDALRDEVRRPLTEWEDAEDARVANAKAVIQHIQDCGRGFIGGEPQPAGLLLAELEKKVVIDASFGEFEELARNALAASLERIHAAMEAERKAAADAAELEILREEAAQREAAEQERKEAEETERLRAGAEKAEQEREQRLRDEAAETARKEAEEAARVEQVERDRKHQEELAAERQRAEQAEQAETARKAEERRLAAEQAARDADRENRSKVMGAAKEAIMEAGDIDEQAAKKIVLAIAANGIPAVTIRF